MTSLRFSAFKLFFFAVAELVESFDRLLLKFAPALWVFLIIDRLLREVLLSYHQLVAIQFKHDVKAALRIDTAFFGGRINLGENMRVNVLEDVLVVGEIFFKHKQIILVLIDEFSNDLEDSRLANVSTVQVFEVVFLADVPIKLGRNAFSPQHKDHLVFHLVRDFSLQRERIQVFDKRNVHFQDKVFVVKVSLGNFSIANIGQKVSRFDSGGRIFYSSGSVPNLMSFHDRLPGRKEILVFF